MWFSQIVRTFFFTLDSTLFNFIPTVYDLLMDISRTSILSQGQIKIFADRIQALLGVFMLFKVTFSLITYIIMPDEFSDKGKGFGKLWQNIIISLILLILTPYVFNMAYELQTMILEDNVIAGLIFGQNDEQENYLSTAGDKMAYTIMEPFFSPNTSIGNLYVCTTMYDINSGGARIFNDDCKNELKSLYGNTTGSSSTYIDNYVAGVEKSNLGLFFRLDIAKATVAGDRNVGTEMFLIDYNVPVTTVVAVIVLLLLITFCMDVALRSIKLSFLQLISPIPIISYIDPKSGKDGMFKKWYQMCFSTYLSLFVRLLALYLAVYIIGLVNGMTDIVTGATVTSSIVKIFIYVGVLMFAKQLPKILEGFGIKLDGDGKFTLNPFKKFEDNAFGGKQILGGAKGLAATGLAGAAVMGANTANLKERWNGANGFWGHAAAALSPIGGLIGGARRGIVGTVQGKKFGEIYSNSYSGAIQARKDRENRAADGVGVFDTIGASVQKTFGMSTAADTVKSVNEDFKAFQSAYDNIKNVAVAQDDTHSIDIRDAAGNIIASDVQGAKGIDRLIKQMEKTSVDRNNYANDADYLDAVNKYNSTLKVLNDALDSRINDLANGADTGRVGANAAIHDAAKSMEVLQERINTNARQIDKDFVEISGANVTARYKSSKGSQTQFSGSAEAIKAQDVDKYARGVGPMANSGKK